MWPLLDTVITTRFKNSLGLAAQCVLVFSVILKQKSLSLQEHYPIGFKAEAVYVLCEVGTIP